MSWQKDLPNKEGIWAVRCENDELQLGSDYFEVYSVREFDGIGFVIS